MLAKMTLIVLDGSSGGLYWMSVRHRALGNSNYHENFEYTNRFILRYDTIQGLAVSSQYVKRDTSGRHRRS